MRQAIAYYSQKLIPGSSSNNLLLVGLRAKQFDLFKDLFHAISKDGIPKLIYRELEKVVIFEHVFNVPGKLRLGMCV